jgi:hypothetical protein
MLPSWNLGGIAMTFGAKARAATAIEAIPEPTYPCEVMLEPTLPRPTPATTLKRRRLLEPAPRQPSSKEHAERLLNWIYADIDLTDGPITHAAMLEFYTEMLIELDWTPRPWNPVAHQFRLLTTGSRKTYAWITTTTGAVHRLRIYPIPRRAAGAMANRKDSAQQQSAA